MKPLKIAMMSMTHGHTRKYYQTLMDNPKLDWVAVATANDEVKEIFLNSVEGIPCYDSELEMLDAHPEIEAVVLASENCEHLRQMKLCAERGIHILSMKIPTFQMDEYDEMIDIVEKNNIYRMVRIRNIIEMKAQNGWFNISIANDNPNNPLTDMLKTAFREIGLEIYEETKTMVTPENGRITIKQV